MFIRMNIGAKHLRPLLYIERIDKVFVSLAARRRLIRERVGTVRDSVASAHLDRASCSTLT